MAGGICRNPARGQEGGTLETASSVNVNYDAKTWERVADEPLPCDVATFRRLMESTMPDLHTKLQARHEKLCAIYAHARKRSNELVPIDLQAMADALELSNAVGDDFQ